MGLSVLLIDYRGFGQSSQRFPSEKIVYQDVEAVWNYLVHQKNINPQKICVFGHSLGGAIAIEFALRHPEIAGLIVESSFTSMRDMVDFQEKYWMFPINWLLQQRFASLEKVKDLKMPILFAHGTADEVVPFWMSEALYGAATEPKQLLMVEAADHNKVRQVGGVEYFNTLQQFIQQAFELQYP
jgi:alpha-beta hydrolase superfamily lysophospholipase